MTQRANPPERWNRRTMLLAAGNAADKGGAAALSLAAGAAPGKVVPGGTALTLLLIGHFAENKASSGSDQLIDVDFEEEIEAHWYANSATSLAITDVGGLCYLVDDRTVAKSATGKSVAGRVWAVDSTRGVLVQKLTATQAVPSNTGYLAIDATNDLTITVAQGQNRKITAAGSAKNITLGTTGAVAGDKIYITRAALGASTATNILNGGTGAGTLMAQTANKAAGCIAMFDGTDWSLVASYQAP